MGRLHLVFISPKREPGTPEHEITDQEHSPLFPTRKTNDVNVSERRASPLRIACDVMEIQKLYLCCCRHSPPWLWILETLGRRLQTSRKRERETLICFRFGQFELLEGAIRCQPTSAAIIPTWPSGAGRPGFRTLGENFLAATHFCFIPA